MNKDIKKQLTKMKKVAKGYSISRIVLTNGEILKGVIEKIDEHSILIKLSSESNKAPVLTIPGHSILYVSDIDLTE